MRGKSDKFECERKQCEWRPVSEGTKLLVSMSHGDILFTHGLPDLLLLTLLAPACHKSSGCKTSLTYTLTAHVTLSERAIYICACLIFGDIFAAQSDRTAASFVPAVWCQKSRLRISTSNLSRSVSFLCPIDLRGRTTSIRTLSSISIRISNANKNWSNISQRHTIGMTYTIIRALTRKSPPSRLCASRFGYCQGFTPP